MDSVFKLTKSGTCGIIVDGLEHDNSEYLETNIVSTRNYTFAQSATLNAVTSIKYDGTTKTEFAQVVEHLEIDSASFVLPQDGLYEIAHIIIPTEAWLAYVISTEISALEIYNYVYYYNTTNKKFFKYVNGTSTEVTTEEILEANATPPETVTDKTITLIRSEKNTFGTCYINECFAKTCDILFKEISLRCPTQVKESRILNRDVLWMGINIIKYLLETSQLYEAQRILEELNYCNYFCKDTNFTTKTPSNCGCPN